MAIETSTPGVDDLGEVLDALRTWQQDAAPLQLHPGDVGWFWRFGAGATADALRTWRRDGRDLAVGLLDGPDLLRLGIAPDLLHDEELARRIADDATRPERGVLGEGAASVEAPVGALVDGYLAEAGWGLDEPWALLRRDLAEPVEVPDVRVRVVGPEEAASWAEVLRSSFGGTTAAPERWHALATGLPYADARCLVVHDDRAAVGRTAGDPGTAPASGPAVAVVGVWSAGPGRPGLIEPMGVHADHRGRGLGRAVTLAGLAALRGLGASSALVATAADNVGGVATYVSAGFVHLPERRDRRRDAD
ncbi:GNAT family N-acetyltransferase [Cellulosimicrobium protaetiae]|uniref:GNAT family N-acetyltransferase n=1 Tax=Cellulosimicrobium protaetiae TaxID=2587808 RepID=A0A6M5UGU5_9MICO|nr:GNAT family N-acetyltransferase [Cellulosimicrobium protaetiae]QJW36298.1 GNAT family N-acetyltransferase [Cellulosimicrobium protaetiae]